MKQTHLLISGQIQGIGYRQFVKQNAQKLGLAGWVRNLPDGKVEAVCQGKKEQLEQLVLLCRKGPFMAEVKDIVVTEAETEKEYSDFVIEATPETI